MSPISTPEYPVAIPIGKGWPMNDGKTVFAQLFEFLPLHEFRKCVRRYRGDYKVLSFSCLDQFLCMAFAQLTFRESLRDIETCLRTVRPKLYHMGIRGGISRNTLANANENRDWRIYADFAQVLIRTARNLYANDPFAVELEQTVYALDSTTIDLCLSLFPWARFRKRKAAVKLHTLLDLRGNIPSFIKISDGKWHDVHILDELLPEPGSYYVMDRGYLDFERLYAISGEHPLVHQDLRREVARRAHPRRTASRTRIVLRDGPRVSGFRTASCLLGLLGLLRHPGQEESSLSPVVFRACRQGDRGEVRSDHRAHGGQHGGALPRQTPPDPAEFVGVML